MTITRAAGNHVTPPANVCLQSTSTRLRTCINEYAAYYLRFGNKSQISQSGLYYRCGSSCISSSCVQHSFAHYHGEAESLTSEAVDIFFKLLKTAHFYIVEQMAITLPADLEINAFVVEGDDGCF